METLNKLLRSGLKQSSYRKLKNMKEVYDEVNDIIKDDDDYEIIKLKLLEIKEKYDYRKNTIDRILGGYENGTREII